MVAAVPQWLYHFLDREGNKHTTSDGLIFFGALSGQSSLEVWVYNFLFNKKFFPDRKNSRVIKRNKKVGSIDKKGNMYIYIGCKINFSKRNEYVILEDVGSKRVINMIISVFDLLLLKYINLYRHSFKKMNGVSNISENLLIKSFMEKYHIEVNSTSLETIKKRIQRKCKQ